MLKRAAVIGLGLIGGSVGLGLRRQDVQVTAFDQNPTSLAQGLELGVIDIAASSVAAAVTGAELVILAVPVSAVSVILEEIKAANFQAVLTDVGSVKEPVLQDFFDVFGEVPAQFVPGHPIAGSEKHGVIAADGDLFRQHRVLLTPLEHTNAEATQLVRELWQSLGADVSLMTTDHHDSILAQTSHLPHLLAYALIDTLSVQGDSLEIFEYAAGGLRDFSRIAASDPTMWRD
ncbi:MAG: prephenate dehydrogenase, partial [Candidatus Azotimanducaceae bacterium]